MTSLTTPTPTPNLYRLSFPFTRSFIGVRSIRFAIPTTLSGGRAQLDSHLDKPNQPSSTLPSFSSLSLTHTHSSSRTLMSCFFGTSNPPPSFASLPYACATNFPCRTVVHRHKFGYTHSSPRSREKEPDRLFSGEGGSTSLRRDRWEDPPPSERMGMGMRIAGWREKNNKKTSPVQRKLRGEGGLSRQHEDDTKGKGKDDVRATPEFE